MVEMLIHRHLQLFLIYITICRVMRKQCNGNGAIKKHTTELPVGFVQYFITINGKPFPYHLAKNDRQSRYLAEFRECYGCGGDHPFADYLTKKEHACYKLFHSNLHCRKGLQGLRDGGIGYKLCTITSI